MSKIVAYTLRAEHNFVALSCMDMTDALMKQEDSPKNQQLEPAIMEAYKKLHNTLLKMLDYKSGEMNTRDVELDFKMSFALLHGIVKAFYRIKGHLLLPKDQRKEISDEAEEHIEEMYEELKEPAADLLWELTQVLKYPDYGLQTLEEVFDRKPAVRPLKVDNKEVVKEFTLNQNDTYLFAFAYMILDLMEDYKDEYDFPNRFYTCRFMHLSDYEAVKKKLNQQPAGTTVLLTLRDVIVVYYTLSLVGKFFVNDSDVIYDELAERIDARKDSPVTAREVRNFFLKFSDHLLSLLKRDFKHNPVFMLETDRVKNW